MNGNKDERRQSIGDRKEEGIREDVGKYLEGGKGGEGREEGRKSGGKD